MSSSSLVLLLLLSLLLVKSVYVDYIIFAVGGTVKLFFFCRCFCRTIVLVFAIVVVATVVVVVAIVATAAGILNCDLTLFMLTYLSFFMLLIFLC